MIEEIMQMEPHGLEMILVTVALVVALVVAALVVALAPPQSVDAVEVAALVNAGMRVPPEHVEKNVKEIKQRLILTVVEPVTAVAGAMQIVQISVPMAVIVATLVALADVQHILHVMEVIALDAVVNVKMKQKAVQIQEVKIAPIVVMSVL